MGDQGSGLGDRGSGLSGLVWYLRQGSCASNPPSPIPHPLIEPLAQCALHYSTRGMTRDSPVNHDGGGDTASTQAARRQEREPTIGAGGACAQGRRLFKFTEQSGSTLDIAGGTETDGTGVFALGCQREEMVKRRHAINATWRQAQAPRNQRKERGRQVAEQFLAFVQHLNQSIGPILVPLHRRLEEFEATIADGRDPLGLRGGKSHALAPFRLH